MLLGAQEDGGGISDGSDNAVQTLRRGEKMLLFSRFRAEMFWVTEGSETCD